MKTYIITYKDRVSNQQKYRLITIDPTEEDINEFMDVYNQHKEVRVFLVSKELSPTYWG